MKRQASFRESVVEPANLENHPDHDVMKKIWDAADPGPEPNSLSIDLAWQKLQRQMQAPVDKVEEKRKSVFLWLAPTFAAVSMLVFALFWGSGSSYVVARGGMMSVPLADSSMVHINSASYLTIDSHFNEKNREVSLEGEAFFAVEKGDFPFIVHTPTADIRVLGTRFNVFARNNSLSVAVEEGSVEVSVSDTNRTIVLEPGQTIAFSGKNLPGESDTALQTDWRDSILMEGRVLPEVCREIERRFDIRIELDAGKLERQQLSGILQVKSPKEMIQSICALLDVEYRYEEGAYIIE